MNTVLKRLVIALCAIMLMEGFVIVFYQTQQAAGSPVRVACVGDSITSDSNYTKALSTLLGTNYTVENFGVGRTTVSRDFNKPYMNQSAFYNAQRFNPDIVVIMLGTNDAFLSEQQRTNFIQDYKALVSSFQTLPSSPVIYIAVPPPVFNNSMGLPPDVLDSQVIPMVNQTATELNLPTIDVHTPLLDNSQDFSKDGVHPDNEASQEIASQVYAAIAYRNNHLQLTR
jgi:alpha-L-fucosidase 2